MHAHAEPALLWYVVVGAAFTVGMMVAFWVAAFSEDDDPECPDREMPELHPDDDDTPSERYATFLRRMGVEPDAVRYPAPAPAPGELGPAFLAKGPRPGEDIEIEFDERGRRGVEAAFKFADDSRRDADRL